MASRIASRLVECHSRYLHCWYNTKACAVGGLVGAACGQGYFWESSGKRLFNETAGKENETMRFPRHDVVDGLTLLPKAPWSVNLFLCTLSGGVAGYFAVLYFPVTLVGVAVCRTSLNHPSCNSLVSFTRYLILEYALCSPLLVAEN